MKIEYFIIKDPINLWEKYKFQKNLIIVKAQYDVHLKLQ